jgi:hypothetical protein
MDKKVKKLSPAMLRALVEQVISETFGPMKDVEKESAEETEADELADSLEKKIDYVKALKIEEARLTRRLNRVRSTLAKASK